MAWCGVQVNPPPPTWENNLFVERQRSGMSNSISRDQQRRILFAKHEWQRLLLQSMIKDLSTPAEMRARGVRLLSRMPRNSSLTRTRNRCVLTGRGRGVHRFCRLSRMKLRELASGGALAGVSKSSW